MPRLIPLTQGRQARVSDSDYPTLSQFKWRYTSGGYAARTVRDHGRTLTVYLHRFLLDAQPGQQIDHRNGDKLDCRRENLRLATGAENQRNKRVSANSRTGLKGVAPYRGKFHARIRVDGRRIHLGYWPDAETAALVYDAAARRFHGEFAYLNFPDCPALPQIEERLDRVLYARQTFEPKASLGKSRYRGVYSERRKWRAKISVGGRDFHLGYFESELEAAEAYNHAALLYHGSRAKLNALDEAPILAL